MSEFIYKPYRVENRTEVFNVLKTSMPGNLTLDWYHWKHEMNPFGHSIAWVAEDSEGIVGCNFFMHYELLIEGKMVKALRSCESAVLPRGRRKGIFSNIIKLAHDLINNEKDYYTMIGTPNENSIQGFLKLGWSQAPLMTYVVTPVLWRASSQLVVAPQIVMNSFHQDTRIGNCVNKPITYLNWRYGPDSGRDYFFASLINSNFPNACIYKIRKIGRFKAIIVMELTGREGDRTEIIRSICAREKVFLVVIKKNEHFKGIPPIVLKKSGYEFIYYKPKVLMDKWDLSLGDMEDVL